MSSVKIRKKTGAKKINIQRGRVTPNPLNGLSKREIEQRQQKAYEKFCKRKKRDREISFADVFISRDERQEEYKIPNIQPKTY